MVYFHVLCYDQFEEWKIFKELVLFFFGFFWKGYSNSQIIFVSITLKKICFAIMARHLLDGFYFVMYIYNLVDMSQ